MVSRKYYPDAAPILSSMVSTLRCIWQTLTYADIFDCPLTDKEIWHYLIASREIKKEEFNREIAKLSKKMGTSDGFYFLQDREELVKKRKRRLLLSKQKIAGAKKIISYFSFIPTLLVVGISGNVSMYNAEKEDDIDLFIITKKNTLWITRLLMLIVLQFLGKRRTRNAKDTEDMICINMLITEESLNFDKQKQDIYTAHEIVQMMPILDRENTCQKFLNANKWVVDYLPNSLDTKILRYKDTKKKNKKILNISISQHLNIFELPARTIQQRYMEKHQTTEQVTKSYAAFHPNDYRKKVLKEYAKRLKKTMTLLR